MSPSAEEQKKENRGDRNYVQSEIKDQRQDLMFGEDPDYCRKCKIYLRLIKFLQKQLKNAGAVLS